MLDLGRLEPDRGFSFIASLRRGIRAGWRNFRGRFVGQQRGQSEEEGLCGEARLAWLGVAAQGGLGERGISGR